MLSRKCCGCRHLAVHNGLLLPVLSLQAWAMLEYLDDALGKIFDCECCIMVVLSTVTKRLTIVYHVHCWSVCGKIHCHVAAPIYMRPCHQQQPVFLYLAG